MQFVKSMEKHESIIYQQVSANGITVHAQGIVSVTVEDKLIPANDDKVLITYDDFARETVPGKVTFKDGTTKTIALEVPNYSLDGKQRVEFVECEGKHVVRFYPMVRLTTKNALSTLSELLDNYQFTV